MRPRLASPPDPASAAYHPRMPAYRTFDRSAKELGYRMPGEFEPVDAVWVTPPHNLETWPACFDQAAEQFARFFSLLKQSVPVRDTSKLGLATNDSWIRDYGPLFVTDRNGHIACHDFVFNCWGDKYQPYDDDNRVATRIAEHLGLPLWKHSMVLEGGSIEVNGSGTVMTTRQCLLNPNRNPDLTASQIEEHLHNALGTRHVIWLPGGIRGDDTDGHIDDIARFVDPQTVVAVRTNDTNHPDHDTLDQNWRALETAVDQDGQRLTLLPLPMPDPVFHDFPGDDTEPAGRRQLPASYANFLIVNRAVYVPVFGQTQDDRALAVLDAAMPGHTVVPVRSEYLVVGLGALHCLTMQQPRAETPARD